MENVYLSLFTSHSVGSFKEKRLNAQITPFGLEALHPHVEGASIEAAMKKPNVKTKELTDRIGKMIGKGGVHETVGKKLLEKKEEKRDKPDKQLADIHEVTKDGNTEWEKLKKAADEAKKDPTKTDAFVKEARTLIEAQYNQLVDLTDAKTSPDDLPYNTQEQIEALTKNVQAITELHPDLSNNIVPMAPMRYMFIKGMVEKYKTNYADWRLKVLKPLLEQYERAKGDSREEKIAMKEIVDQITALKQKNTERIHELAATSFKDREFNAHLQIAELAEQNKDLDSRLNALIDKKPAKKPDEPAKKPDEEKEKEKEKKPAEKIPEDVQKKVDDVKKTYEAFKKDESKNREFGEARKALNEYEAFKKLSPEQKQAIADDLNTVAKSPDKFVFNKDKGIIELTNKAETPPSAVEKGKENAFVQFLRELIQLLKELGYIHDRGPGDKMPAVLDVVNLKARQFELMQNKGKLEKEISEAKTAGKDTKTLEAELKKVTEELELVNAELKKVEELRQPGRMQKLEQQLRMRSKHEFGVDVFEELELIEDARGLRIKAYIPRERVEGIDPRRLQRLTQEECWGRNRVPCELGYMDGMPTATVQVVNVVQVNAGAAGDEESKKLD